MRHYFHLSYLFKLTPHAITHIQPTTYNQTCTYSIRPINLLCLLNGKLIKFTYCFHMKILQTVPLSISLELNSMPAFTSTRTLLHLLHPFLFLFSLFSPYLRLKSLIWLRIGLHQLAFLFLS